MAHPLLFENAFRKMDHVFTKLRIYLKQISYFYFEHKSLSKALTLFSGFTDQIILQVVA